jgi:hypothetical protein
VEKVLDGVNVVQWLRRGGGRVRGRQRGAPRGARQRQESRWKAVSYSRCCLDKEAFEKGLSHEILPGPI